MPKNLADFLKEKTKRKIIGQYDPVSDDWADLEIQDISSQECKQIRESITQFYSQKGYTSLKDNKMANLGLVFHKQKDSKIIAISYFAYAKKMLITTETT